ncbi:exonuclease domain-containing protein [Helicobacter enhydrae]|uniref:exonuclease domain-containing protein n=1 Tax=Helicobacter enhydrae TaxID=222136 RepID=UPI000A051AEB
MWRDAVFCFVDIETTDVNPDCGGLLEIGAILCKGSGEVVGRFEHLVHVEVIPEVIEEITGIGLEDVRFAPSAKEVLGEFRTFIGDNVFVAHNAAFDYQFLNQCYIKFFGIGLYNPTLCTIALAHKTIVAPRYGLSFLNEYLQIFTPNNHRAYADASTCLEIFKKCIVNVPRQVKTTRDLIFWVRKGNQKLVSRGGLEPPTSGL